MAVTNWSWALAQGTNWSSTRSPGCAASKSAVAEVRNARSSGAPGSMIQTCNGLLASAPPADGVSTPQPGRSPSARSATNPRRSAEPAPTRWEGAPTALPRARRTRRAPGPCRRSAERAPAGREGAPTVPRARRERRGRGAGGGLMRAPGPPRRRERRRRGRPRAPPRRGGGGGGGPAGRGGGGGADVRSHRAGQERRAATPAVVGPQGGVETSPADPEPAADVAQEVPPAVDAGHGAVDDPTAALAGAGAAAAPHHGAGRVPYPFRG